MMEIIKLKVKILEEACLNFNDHIAQVRVAFDMDFVVMLITQILAVSHTSIDACHFRFDTILFWRD